MAHALIIQLHELRVACGAGGWTDRCLCGGGIANYLLGAICNNWMIYFYCRSACLLSIEMARSSLSWSLSCGWT